MFILAKTQNFMKTRLLFLFLLINLSLRAGDFRGGDIYIQQHTPYAVQANININLVAHSEIDQITICWGDGSCETLGNPQVYQNSAIDTKTLHFFWIHQYFQHGLYDITVQECCWANDIYNMNLMNEQPIVLQASFKLLDPQTEPFNVMPFTPTLPVASGNLNTFLSYDTFVDVQDGDESTFEICAVDVDNYFFLEEIFGQATNFFFDPLTGGFIWFTPPDLGFFIIKVCITTTRSGQMISETSRDILITIDETIGTDDLSDSNNFNVACYPNPAKDIIQLDYELKKNSNVLITLFDAFGIKIKDIISGNRSSGTYKESFDINNLPEGLYFIKIKTEDQAAVVPFIKKQN